MLSLAAGEGLQGQEHCFSDRFDVLSPAGWCVGMDSVSRPWVNWVSPKTFMNMVGDMWVGVRIILQVIVSLICCSLKLIRGNVFQVGFAIENLAYHYSLSAYLVSVAKDISNFQDFSGNFQRGTPDAISLEPRSRIAKSGFDSVNNLWGREKNLEQVQVPRWPWM